MHVHRMRVHTGKLGTKKNLSLVDTVFFVYLKLGTKKTSTGYKNKNMGTKKSFARVQDNSMKNELEELKIDQIIDQTPQNHK